MDCKPIFTKRRRQSMTLVELLVAAAIASIVGLAIINLTYYAMRSFAAISNYIDLDQKSRTALDTMSRQIRQVSALTTNTSHSMTFLDFDGGSLSFDYDPVARQLWRTKKGIRDRLPLLVQCDRLEFAIFQRTPFGGAYEQFATAADPTAAKVVQMSWLCSRTILGSKLNTAAALSAKVVLRN